MIQTPMRSFPVDASRFKAVMCVVGPKPRVVRDTGETRTDREGRPLFVVSVSVQHESGEGASVLPVVVAGEVPNIEEGTKVTIHGLTANLWTMGDREGLNFRAETIVPVGPPDTGGRKTRSGDA